jgi:hypothetical protein
LGELRFRTASRTLCDVVCDAENGGSQLFSPTKVLLGFDFSGEFKEFNADMCGSLPNLQILKSKGFVHVIFYFSLPALYCPL